MNLFKAYFTGLIPDTSLVSMEVVFHADDLESAEQAMLGAARASQRARDKSGAMRLDSVWEVG